MTASIGVFFDGSNLNAGTAAIEGLAFDVNDKAVFYQLPGGKVAVIKIGV